MQPEISIIIVNYNGLRFLDACLSSIYRNHYSSLEIILVDNCSSDKSVYFVRQKYPKVIVIQNESNLGYAGGNNVGYRASRGKYLLILNNDTRIEKNFFINLTKAFSEIPNLACVQPKIVLMKSPDIIDACGVFLTRNLFLYHFGYEKEESLPLYNKKFPVFAAKGACMLIKKKVVDEIGLFDEKFWCYYEETDFCHRLWLAGFECWYYPEAKIFHLVGGTSLSFKSSYIQYINFRNRLTSYLKNFEIKSLVKYLPQYLFINIVLSLYWLMQGKFRHTLSLSRAILWNLLHIKETIEARKQVQRKRRVADKSFFHLVMKKPRLSYYYYIFHGLKNYHD